MKCPKCNHFQDFGSLGACETCGRSDWFVPSTYEAISGGKMVVCPHCERGPTEVPCEKCGAAILGKWLTKEGPADWGDWVYIVVVSIIAFFVILVLGSIFAS